ncbi:MAG: lipase family protein [Mariprofundus sp.]|nr:lipase family protein [Mariprofundus sp.]
MKTIEQRGRTLDAVIHPNKYAPFSGVPDKASFDRAWASNPDWIFANMAHAAYHDAEYLRQLFTPFGAKITFYQSKPDAHGWLRGSQAFLAVWDDKAVLAFRGTEADEPLILDLEASGSDRGFFGRMLPSRLKLPFIPTDIVDDLDFLPFTYSEAEGESQLHRGFYKATKRIWDDIEADLKQLQLPDSGQLYVTGHSLGAAMAVVAGLMYPFNRIVTFGEPSVGNHLDQTMTLGCIHTRYVNGKDPVTRIVPEALYSHHGIKKPIMDMDGADMRYDHSIINYACILGKLP